MANTQVQRTPVVPMTQPQPVPRRRDAPPHLGRINIGGVTSSTPVNQDGCFDFDRVIKSGSVEKRTQKRKNWKSVWIVLRPNTLSIYKSQKEDKLRHQIHLSDLTAVTLLKDPKHKRKNVFGLFSPSKNFHLEASTTEDTQDWVDRIRSCARIEEEEEEMFLASPTIGAHTGFGDESKFGRSMDLDRAVYASSPEPMGHFSSSFRANNTYTANRRRKSSYLESSGLSGNELASHSDFSDNEAVQRRHGASIENLHLTDPQATEQQAVQTSEPRPMLNNSQSQMSVLLPEQDPDKIIWHGWLLCRRTKGGVKQWKDLWAVLRPRNLILYKDQQEYTAQRIIRLSQIVNVVEVDPLSRSKTNCLQIITEEKSYRFCAHDEESLVQCIGAFKSLLAKRRELEAKAKASPPS